MRADRVEVSWDAGKAKWLVRIVECEEVIRRYCNLPKDADERALGAAAQEDRCRRRAMKPILHGKRAPVARRVCRSPWRGFDFLKARGEGGTRK